MSYPQKPTTKRIREMLMLMKQTKEIVAEMKCDWVDVIRQCTMLGLRRVYLTRDERLLIGKHRGMQTKDIP